MASRILSACVAVAYLVLAHVEKGGSGVLRMMGFLVFPMACIWFGEAMGAYAGSWSRTYINTPTPGCFVAFGGWLLLALPLFQLVLWHWNR